MKNEISDMISFLRQNIWKDGLNEVSLKVGNKISFDERSTFFSKKEFQNNQEMKMKLRTKKESNIRVLRRIEILFLNIIAKESAKDHFFISI